LKSSVDVIGDVSDKHIRHAYIMLSIIATGKLVAGVKDRLGGAAIETLLMSCYIAVGTELNS